MVPQNVQHFHTNSNYTHRHKPKIIESRDLNRFVFTRANWSMIHIAKSCKQVSINKSMEESVYKHKIKCYLSMKKNEVLMHTNESSGEITK